MKRLMFVLALLGVLCVGSIVQARQPYPLYWNGDRTNDGEVVGSTTVSFVYDEAAMKMYMGDGVSEIPRNVNGRLHAYGEATYYFAYGKKFHGIFDDAFYNR